jgi:glycosyltransferase involved in cell wall biosynthesis
VVYYSTDLTKGYAGMDPEQVVKLDYRMCRVAQAVCPNSQRIADYLQREAACDPARITVIPNATRASNVSELPLLSPSDPPADLRDLPRPIVGVIGNFASNMDWTLLESAVEKTHDVSWAFVGPTDMPIADAEATRLREKLTGLGGRVRFLGSRPYSQLAAYARCFDAALIPYAKSEPTISGSATRFYEHLAACRPILANRAHCELLTKEPLLKLVDDGAALSAEIERLRRNGFSDGLEEMRWKASRNGTWHVRARDLISAVEQRTKRNVA